MENNISEVIINATTTNNETTINNETNIGPKIIIIIYFILLFFGFCINLCLINSLLLQKKQGTTYIIVQFAFVDILTTGIAVTEIWSLYSENWTFNSIICPLFLGTEVLINVIIIYMHILLNFHAISAWNMQNKNAEVNKNPLTSDESNECLVWSENSTPNRTLNIDYRPRKSSVSIILPSMLIWFTCLSLSIPEFTLSTTVEYHANNTLCTIVDLHYTYLLQFLLVFFRDILPNLLLVLTFIIALYKLCNNSSLSNVKKNSSVKKYTELKKLLYLSVVLSLLYVVCSSQRSLTQCLHIIFKKFDKTSVENFKMPPLDNIVINKVTSMFLSMLHYCSIILRPIICISIMPSTMSFLRDFLNKNRDDKQ